MPDVVSGNCGITVHLTDSSAPRPGAGASALCRRDPGAAQAQRPFLAGPALARSRRCGAIRTPAPTGRDRLLFAARLLQDARIAIACITISLCQNRGGDALCRAQSGAGG